MSFHKYDIKLGALVEEVPEGSPPSPLPPARSPSDRLRDKVARDSCSSVSKGRSTDTPAENSPETSSGSEHKGVLEVVSTDEINEATPPQLVSTGIDIDDVKEKSKLDPSNQVPVSANIDKKMADLPHADGTNDRSLQLAQPGFHLDASYSPEAEPSRPGAFSVAGIGQQNDANAAPSVPSVVMDVEDIPIAAEVAEDENPIEASKLEDVVVNYRSRKVRVGIFVLFIVFAGAIVGAILGARKRKNEALAECIVEDPSKLGNGQCDGDEYNTEKCQWDMGDCLLLNQFPDCALTPEQSAKLGDGKCHGYPWFTAECGRDAGDCSKCSFKAELELFTKEEIYDYIGFGVGNGICTGMFNFAGCSFDGGDCREFNEKYPDCRLGDQSCSSFNQTYPDCIVDMPEWLGDGTCDGTLNNAACGWDEGDCSSFNERFPDCRKGDLSCSSFNASYPNCIVDMPEWLGDKTCDGAPYNVLSCDFDFGDCVKEERFFEIPGIDFDEEFLRNYPFCDPMSSLNAANGRCDGGDANTEECGWEGGDCLEFNRLYPGCNVDHVPFIGDGYCDEEEYNTEECGWDGGDCIVGGFPDCTVHAPDRIGDGTCDGGEYNTAECGWDGGDCIHFNELYPDCHVDFAYKVGDGECDGGEWNTAECIWDGEDCLQFNEKYPNCDVLNPHWVGDGRCESNWDGYNTAECGWDGGDCLIFKETYPDCNVDVSSKIGDGECHNYDNYNTAECGWDGSDCISFNEKYPDCHVYMVRWIGNGNCDGGEYNTEECHWDGGDCIDFNKLYPDCSVEKPWLLGDGGCENYENYNTIECGWDGGDCVEFNEKYPDCRVDAAYWIGDGECDEDEFNTAECGWDGGDCM